MSSRMTTGPVPARSATSARPPAMATVVSSRRRTCTASSSARSRSASAAIGGDQEVEGQLGVGDPACGVEPRHDAEPHVAGRRMSRIVRRTGDEAAKPGMRGHRQLGQAEPDDGPALPVHRSHVRDRAHHAERGQVRDGPPAPGEQRRGEAEREPGAGQVRVGVGAVGPVRIHDGHGGRQGSKRHVMVGHDHVHAHRGRGGHLINVAHPAVAGHHQARTARRERAEAFDGQTVSLGQAGRYVADGLDAQRTEGQDPDRDRGHPVRVVVAPDRDRLPRPDGELDPVQRRPGIGHEVHRRKVLDTRIQESRGLVIGLDPAPSEQGGDRRREPGQTRWRVNRRRQEPLEPGSDHAGPW